MLISKELLAELVKELKAVEKKIVFTNGCFDIIHRGHVKYLDESRKLGDILVIGLNTDSSVKRLGKGDDRPVNNQEDRAFVLSALKPVDYVCYFDEDTPYALIKALMPDILVKGGDYTRDTIVGADIVENNGGEVVVIPLVKGKSTTSIINKMRK